MATTLFLMSLQSWEISSAHFNSAVTFGSFIYSGDYKQNLLTFIMIIVVQIFGSMTGIFLTWYFSLINEENNQTVTIPMPPTLCPQLEVISSDSSMTNKRCKIEGLHLYIILYELFSSFCFVFTWIVIRNFKLRADYANKKLESFVKAMLVAVLYLGCASIGYKVTNF